MDFGDSVPPCRGIPAVRAPQEPPRLVCRRFRRRQHLGVRVALRGMRFRTAVFELGVTHRIHIAGLARVPLAPSRRAVSGRRSSASESVPPGAANRAVSTSHAGGNWGSTTFRVSCACNSGSASSHRNESHK